MWVCFSQNEPLIDNNPTIPHIMGPLRSSHTLDASKAWILLSPRSTQGQIHCLDTSGRPLPKAGARLYVGLRFPGVKVLKDLWDPQSSVP